MSNDSVNVQEFLAKYRESGQLDDALLRLGFGTADFSIKEEGYDGESDEDEWFRDLLSDSILPLQMSPGETRVLGPCEIHCSFIHQVSQKNEYDTLEAINFYIVEFQCDTILVAFYGMYDEEEFGCELAKIISSEGIFKTSETGYLEEMTEDLQAIEESD